MESISLDLGERVVEIGTDKVLGFCDKVTLTAVYFAPVKLTNLQNTPVYLRKPAPWEKKALEKMGLKLKKRSKGEC